MHKEDRVRGGLPSPDVYDSWALTFSEVDTDRPGVRMTAEAMELLQEIKGKRKIKSGNFLTRI